jgi:hypothetical protein
LLSRQFRAIGTGFTAYRVIVIDTNALLMQQLSLDICSAQNWAKYITAGWPFELNKKTAFQLVDKKPRAILALLGSGSVLLFADQLKC